MEKYTQPNGEPMSSAVAENPSNDASLQRWIRIPRGTEVCPHTGLRRSALHNLVYQNRKAIRVLNLREPGAKRGAVLIWLPSLMQYLHQQADEQQAQELTDDQVNALPSTAGA
jgi:hypothetical protein